jgi:3-methyl-2-oxobutanoate hydroxymethyltransferase
MDRQKVTIKRLKEKKDRKEKITMLSAYDYPMGMAMDEAQIDMVCVGDSVATVMLGHPNTIRISLEEMLHHSKAVTSSCKFALTIGDMPFGSYNESKEQAIHNANRFLKEGGVDTVILEGGGEFVADVTASLVKAGIPVMTVLGVNPQMMHLQSGLNVRGSTAEEAFTILKEGLLMEKAGAFALELLFIPEQLAKIITERVSIPTIGLGSGRFCDGQLLITYDLLGLRQWFTAKFAKRYANLSEDIKNALNSYREDVKNKQFPQEDNVFTMSDREYDNLEKLIKSKL